MKTAIGFSPFQLIHRVEAVTLVECEIQSLKIVIHVLPDTNELEERLLHLEHLYEKHRDALKANEAHKNRVKINTINRSNLRFFLKGSLSCSGIKTKNPWGHEILGLCGWDLMSCQRC